MGSNEEGAAYLPTKKSFTPGKAQESSFSFSDCKEGKLKIHSRIERSEMPMCSFSHGNVSNESQQRFIHSRNPQIKDT